MKHYGVSAKIFGTVRQKLSGGKLLIPPFSFPLQFSVLEMNGPLKDSPTNFLNTVRQKIFDGKS